MMIVVMKSNATAKEVGAVIKKVEELGFTPHHSSGEKKTIIGMVGNGKKVNHDIFLVMPGVESVVPILKPFKSNITLEHSMVIAEKKPK